MQQRQTEDESSERAFATWYASMRGPSHIGYERRLENVDAEMQVCERYLRRREKRWRVLDGIRRRSLGEKQTRLVQLRAEKKRLERTLDELRQSDAYTYGVRMFSRIKATPRVAQAICADTMLTIITERLYCYGPNGTGFVWYRLGEYTIEIDLDGGIDWARWRTKEGWRPNGFLAPQVPSHGVVKCVGEAASALIDSARESFRYDMVVNVLVRFTECPGTRPAMNGWPIVPASEVPTWYLETPLRWQSP